LPDHQKQSGTGSRIKICTGKVKSQVWLSKLPAKPPLIHPDDSYFEAVNKEYTKRRDTLVNALNKMDGVYCPNPGGAFYVVAKFPIDNADKFCQWMLESLATKTKPL
jgi:hypothetical protein